MTSIVKYGSYTPAAAEQDEKDAKRKGNILKLTPGKHTLRFLPPPVGQNTIFVKVNQHFIEVEGQKRAVVCPRFQARLACPICQEVQRLQKSGDPNDREYAKNIQAQEGTFANVLVRAEAEKGVQVFKVPWNVFQFLTALAKDPDNGGDFTHPENGFDINITRVGTGMTDTRYTCVPDRKTKPLAANVEEINGLLASAPDLAAFASVKAYDDIKSMMEQEGAPSSAPPTARGSQQPRGEKRRTAQDDVLDAEYSSNEDVKF